MPVGRNQAMEGRCIGKVSIRQRAFCVRAEGKERLSSPAGSPATFPGAHWIFDTSSSSQATRSRRWKSFHEATYLLRSQLELQCPSLRSRMKLVTAQFAAPRVRRLPGGSPMILRLAAIRRYCDPPHSPRFRLRRALCSWCRCAQLGRGIDRGNRRCCHALRHAPPRAR